LTGPIECLEVMRSLDGVSAAMKMMQPFDLRERVYGAVVCFLRADHYNDTWDMINA